MAMRTMLSERRPLLLGAAWIVLSLAWAAVILVTDEVAWPVVGWIVTTLGPLSVLSMRDGA